MASLREVAAVGLGGQRGAGSPWLVLLRDSGGGTAEGCARWSYRLA